MKRPRSLCLTICFTTVLIGLSAAKTWANEEVSLTQATTCPATNGNGGNWCQGSNGPAFNLSSFTTQNITTTGSAGFFVIDNNTGATVTSLTLDFIGTLGNGALGCGGGGSGIQGSGPGSGGTTTCSVTAITGGYAITWNNLTWANNTDFDLQIASFSNGTTGDFGTPTVVPEPATLLLLGTGLLVLGAAVKVRMRSRGGRADLDHAMPGTATLC